MKNRSFQPENDCLQVLVCLLFAVACLCAEADQAVYTDSLQTGWEDWGLGHPELRQHDTGTFRQ